MAAPKLWPVKFCENTNFIESSFRVRPPRPRSSVYQSRQFCSLCIPVPLIEKLPLVLRPEKQSLEGWSVFCLSTTYSIVQRHCSNVEASVHLNIAGSVRTAVDGVIVEYKIPNVLCGTICDYDLFTDNGQCHQATCVMSRIVQDWEREYLTVLTCRDSPRIIADMRVAEFELNEFLQLPGYNALSPKIFHGSYVCPVIMRAYYQHNP